VLKNPKIYAGKGSIDKQAGGKAPKETPRAFLLHNVAKHLPWRLKGAVSWHESLQRLGLNALLDDLLHVPDRCGAQFGDESSDRYG